MLLVSIIDQRVQPAHRARNDVTTAPAIAAIRAAKRHMGLASKADGTRPAIARTGIDFGLI